MRLKLPAKVKAVIDIINSNGYEAYAVGGCVRDLILAREPGDFDITTSALPEDIKRIFKRTVDTGIAHGTVTVLYGGESFEVTTYRIDGTYEDGRHPSSVTFTPSLAEDLKRRDFTINAMAYSDRDGLVDLNGGMADLQARRIRCVGDADERFTEDALRILRAVRFAAQLDFSIEKETAYAIRNHAGNLRQVSAERIRTELIKLLTSPHPEKLKDLYDLGVTAVVLPEFDRLMATPQNTPHHDANVGIHTIRTLTNIAADPVLRLTMLLHDMGKPACRTIDGTGRDHFKGHAAVSAKMAEKILRRLKCDNDTISRVVNLVKWHDLRPKPDERSVRRAMVKVGPAAFADYIAVRRADELGKSAYKREEKLALVDAAERIAKEQLQKDACLSVRQLAINGSDLLAIGAKGREVGEILNGALALVVDDQEMNTREALMEYARFEHSKRNAAV